MMQTFEYIISDLKKEKTNGLIGIPSGFTELDKVTNGFQNGQLIILAGRPAIGKTRFALSIVRNLIVSTDKRIAIFSLAETAKRITKFILRDDLDNTDENTVIAPIYIDDNSSISVLELMESASIIKHEKNIDLIIIDYLQLFTDFEINPTDNSKKDFENTIRLLKILAKSLNIPILVLSTLSKKVEERGLSYIPFLNDLNDYGNITRYADLVLALYNNQYYGIETDEDGESTKDQAIIYIQQNRNSLLGEIKLKYNSLTGDFTDLPNKYSDFISNS
jgi:replicative DNA helicase